MIGCQIGGEGGLFKRWPLKRGSTVYCETYLKSIK